MKNKYFIICTVVIVLIVGIAFFFSPKGMVYWTSNDSGGLRGINETVCHRCVGFVQEQGDTRQCFGIRARCIDSFPSIGGEEYNPVIVQKPVSLDGEISSEDRLDLSGQNLKKIPESVFTRTNLKELNVSNNLLDGAIQAEIRHLQNLKVLNASDNQMTGVPAEIGQLRSLEILNLSHNQLTGLPHELGNLEKLRVFDVSGNDYSKQDLEMIRKNLPSGVTIITQ